MKREDILERSRSEKNTEYEVKVSQEALGRSVWVLAVICILFAFAKIILSDIRGLEQVIPFWEFPSILSAYSAAVNLFIYKRMKSKVNLVIGVLSLIGSIILTYLYVVTL